MSITYYGIVRLGARRYAEVRVHVTPGEKTSQEYTGREFPSQRAAVAATSEATRLANPRHHS